MYRRDCHARKKVLQGVGGGGAANPSDLSFFFFFLHRFHPGVRVRGAGQVFCVLSKENFGSANVVTVSSFNQQV